jgi:pimeloyl-ACP methyl ester carboxylesterase
VASERDGLVCPACGSPARTSDERFCASCGMPLVVAGDPVAAESPISEAHARARKVRPELARGELVRVAGGRNQAEAELIHGLLLEEGIPSLVRRSAAFDVPDFLAAGQRDVLVPESGAAAARELLAQAELVPADGVSSGAASLAGGGAEPSHVLKLGAAIALGALLAALVAWVLVGLAA